MHVPPPLLREKDPAIPSAVEEVVFIALAKDPQKRFATALEQAVPDEMRRLSAEKPTRIDSLLPPQPISSDSIYWTVRASLGETLSSDPAPVKPAHSPGNDQLKLSNPVVHSTPLQTVFLFNEHLTDPSEFFGRVRERETLRNRTRKGASTSIVGPRRMGKTWLMNYSRLVVPKQQLYNNFYCPGTAIPAEQLVAAKPGTGNPPFVEALAAANTGDGYWDEGWQICSIEDSGVVVRKEVLEL